MQSLRTPHKFVLVLLIFVFLCSVALEIKAEKDTEMEKTGSKFTQKIHATSSIKANLSCSSAVQSRIIYFRFQISRSILNC